MKKVFLIHGFKRSGKDTIAKILQEELSNSKIISLASPIKNILQEMFGLTTEELETIKDKETLFIYSYDENIIKKKNRFRHYIITLGQELKKINPYIWSEFVLQEIYKDINEYDYFVIPDVRFFEEEYMFLRRELPFDIITIKVKKNGIESDGTEPEKGIDDKYFDYVIENNGTINDLRKQVIRIINENCYNR